MFFIGLSFGRAEESCCYGDITMMMNNIPDYCSKEGLSVRKYIDERRLR
jgi:hypothetical protein